MCWWPLEVSWVQVEKRRGHRDGDSSDLCLLRWRSQDVGWGFVIWGGFGCLFELFLLQSCVSHPISHHLSACMIFPFHPLYHHQVFISVKDQALEVTTQGLDPYSPTRDYHDCGVRRGIRETCWWFLLFLIHMHSKEPTHGLRNTHPQPTLFHIHPTLPHSHGNHRAVAASAARDCTHWRLGADMV